ncbi:MAG: porin [Gemmatimonadaceae bacterium]|nr:porin [Gemmatimonadaceae bacterium]
MLASVEAADSFSPMLSRCVVVVLAAALGAHPCVVAGQPSRPTPTITWSGYLDGYLALDAGRPRTLDRPYTTTAARHAEFNINLAHVAVSYDAPRVRGRLALQAGTSVQANYASEPTVGMLSGSSLARHLQEAYAGVQLDDDLWLDAGVYFAPFGRESWISADNWTYTRSLIADNSPYYQSGVKLSWQAAPSLALQFNVMNGWQNISETNDDKALAVSADWTFRPHQVLSYDAFFGNEAPDSVPSRFRTFHEVSWQGRVSTRVDGMATLDVGRQARSSGGGTAATWWGGAVLTRLALRPNTAWLALRVETYADRDNVLVSTNGAGEFVVRGGSVNLDLAPASGILWRSELRVLGATRAVFPDRDTASGTGTRSIGLTTSLALRF